MPAEIYLVKVGMTMTEGMVEEWYIPDGARVEKGQLLYRLETEKVNLDVDAETAGTVKHVVGVGVTMKPGDVIGYIYGPGEDIPATASVPTPVPAPDRVEVTALRPSPLPHHRTCGFPHPAVEADGHWTVVKSSGVRRPQVRKRRFDKA